MNPGILSLAKDQAAIGAGAFFVKGGGGTTGGAGQVPLVVGAKIFDGQVVALALHGVGPLAAHEVGELGDVCLLN